MEGGDGIIFQRFARHNLMNAVDAVRDRDIVSDKEEGEY